MQIQWHHHGDREALAGAVAGTLSRIAAAAIQTHGRALLVLAGGNTPLPAYRVFAGSGLEWSKLCVLPSDERWVAHDDPACNLGQLREAMAGATGVRLAGLTPPTPDARVCTTSAEASLAEFGDDDFDVVLLGMGMDGHVASLFPGTDALDAAHTGPDAADVLVVHPSPLPPEAPYPRISLSLPRLLRTRSLLLVVGGADKRDLLEAVIGGARPGLPVARLLAAAPGATTIHWSP